MNWRTALKKPNNEHPKRPILGFDCPRSEVSGARLWGWAKEEFGTPEKFFEKFFILNYCPLVFMEESGKNRTPDKCTKEEREKLYKRVWGEYLLRIALGLGAVLCERSPQGSGLARARAGLAQEVVTVLRRKGRRNGDRASTDRRQRGW